MYKHHQNRRETFAFVQGSSGLACKLELHYRVKCVSAREEDMVDNATSLPSYDLGGCTIRLLDGGMLKLDGGAMFGIIPKTLWQRSTPADEKNRIKLACNCLLVEWQRETARRVIIETGHGCKYDTKEQGFFEIDPARWLLSSLIAADIDPGSITDVFVSHLHFDHAGGLTHPDGDRVVSTFPNAKVHVQRREYEDACAGFGTMKTTYRHENLTPINEREAWILHDGDAEAIPGISVQLTPGHTCGHQAVVVKGNDRSAIFPGDAMPTAAHVGAPYNMAYDLFPIENRDSKSRFLKTAAEENRLIFIDHETETPVVRVECEKNWYILRSI